MLNTLPDEQELDWKRPMVSPAAVQRNPPKVTAMSHKHPGRLALSAEETL